MICIRYRNVICTAQRALACNLINLVSAMDHYILPLHKILYIHPVSRARTNIRGRLLLLPAD